MATIEQFQAQHGLHFADPDLLLTAFTHSSYVNEVPNGNGAEPPADNERLEFLGDAVVGFVVGELLYARFPAAHEGELTSMRAALVRREALARYARQLHLGDYLRLGHGEEESGGRRRPATLCATFEAVMGAVYLDQGLDAVRQMVMPLVAVDLGQAALNALHKDAKSRLQEWTQRQYGAPPRYKVVMEVGPDHARQFTTQVLVKDLRWGVGEGTTKQESAQAAAAMALARLGEPAPEYAPDPELEARWPLDDVGPVTP
jgi:ribonuclease-3